MGREHIGILEKVFGVLHQMEETLHFFLQNEEMFDVSEEIQRNLACAYADLVRLTIGVTIHYKKTNVNKQTLLNLGGFDSLFGTIVDSFFHHRDHFSDAVWSASLQRSAGMNGNCSYRVLILLLCTNAISDRVECDHSHHQAVAPSPRPDHRDLII